METRAPIGWSVVGVQGLLIVGAVALRGPQVWITPTWAPLVTTTVAVLALVVAGAAVVGLGPSATASPVPRQSGVLRTEGIYGVVRHPIYSGVIVAVGAWAFASGTSFRILSWLLLVMLFVVKARWEEGMLVERFPEYVGYQRSTPRFVPRLRRSR